MTLSGFMDSVMELVRFVGLLASEGLRLENCHVLLLNQTLAFYETVHSAMINLINMMFLTSCDINRSSILSFTKIYVLISSSRYSATNPAVNVFFS